MNDWGTIGDNHLRVLELNNVEHEQQGDDDEHCDCDETQPVGIGFSWSLLSLSLIALWFHRTILGQNHLEPKKDPAAKGGNCGDEKEEMTTLSMAQRLLQ